MRRVLNYFFIVIGLIAMTTLNSCQSEDEMEDRIIQGYCWQGVVPVRSWSNYYSRFYFDDNFTGIEEIWKNGRYSDKYQFTWGWLNNSYGVLVLNYGYGDKSCIEISGGISGRHLRGYFYEDIDEYYNYRWNQNDPDRDNRWIDLTSSSQNRYH